MSKLHPDIEAVFDNADQTLLCLMASDFTPIAQSEFYGELNADLLNLRDRYRTEMDEKKSAPSAGTPEADKDSSKNPTFSVEESKENVKPKITLTCCEGGIMAESQGGIPQNRCAYFIDTLVRALIGSGCNLQEIVTGLTMAAHHINIPIYRQALIVALIADKDGTLL